MAAMTTGLDRIIPPEITGDWLAEALTSLASSPGLRTLLEIGASSGQGSTEALVRGMLANPDPPRLFSLEVSRARCQALAERYAAVPQVVPCNLSSVGLADFPSADEVRRFYADTPSALNRYPLDSVLDWLAQDMAYIRDNAIPVDGIAAIKRRHGIDVFDAVLIDGSEFTGRAELDQVYGARAIVLDDITGFKNWHNHHRLLADPAYEIVVMNRYLRAGFSVFVRR